MLSAQQHLTPPASNELSARHRWFSLAVLASALFLIVIDMTVLYTALPRLTHDLHASASQKLWILNAYPLVMAGLLLGMGTLGDRLGHKRLFVGGLVIFGIASLLAAFSPTAANLIASRALLAVGASMMMPATLSIIRIIFTDEKERSLAIGLWAAVASGGAALGPVIGGALLEHFWWGSVFLINVPIVLLSLVFAVLLIPDRRVASGKQWDLLSSVQVMVGLIGVTYALKEVSKLKPAYPVAAAALLIGATFLVLFIRRQRDLRQPLIDFRLFTNPRFNAGVLTAVIASIAMIGFQLALTQRLQLVLALSPLQAGLFLLPLPVASFFLGPVTGALMPRLGAERIMWVALLIMALSLSACLFFYHNAGGALLVLMTVFGAGIGASMTAASSSIMLGAPEDKAGMAASIEEVSYELGGLLGIAIMGSLLSAVYTATLTLPANTDLAASARDSLDEALLMAESLPPAAAANLLEQANAAFDKGFACVLVASALLLFAAAWQIRRAAQPASVHIS